MSPAAPVQASLDLQLTPIPTKFDVGQQRTQDGRDWVTISCRTPLGVQVYMVPAEIAEQLGEVITGMGRQVRTGLVLASALQGAPPGPASPPRPAGHHPVA